MDKVKKCFAHVISALNFIYKVVIALTSVSISTYPGGETIGADPALHTDVQLHKDYQQLVRDET